MLFKLASVLLFAFVIGAALALDAPRPLAYSGATADHQTASAEGAASHQARGYQGSSYLNWGAPGNFPSVGGWNGRFTTGWSAVPCSGTPGPYCALKARDNAHLYRPGLKGNVTVSDLGTGSASVALALNGNVLQSFPLVAGNNGFNVDLPAQMFNLDDQISVVYSGPSGASFVPGTSFWYPFDMLFLTLTEVSSRRADQQPYPFGPRVLPEGRA